MGLEQWLKKPSQTNQNYSERSKKMADKPVTREEKYLAYLTGDYRGELPKPITRKEKYLYEICLKGIGGEISPEEIKAAVNEYLEKNPVKPGATTEQAQQIEQNKTDVASLKEETGSLKEDLDVLGGKYVGQKISFENGIYINAETRKIQTQDYFSLSYPIKVLSGTSVTVITYCNFALGTGLLDSEGNIQDVVQITTETTQALYSKTIDIPDWCSSIRISCVKTHKSDVAYVVSSLFDYTQKRINESLERIDQLKEDLSNKITKFYASNQGETHITDSDNGKIQDMMLYGKSSQDGVPTPENPVEIKSVVNPTVKVCGENLYPGSDLIGLTKTYTTDFIPVILHKGKIYFSFDTSSDTSDGRYHINAKYFDINKELMGSNSHESIAGNNISHVSFEFDGTKAGINHETIDLKNVSYVKIMFGIYATTATKITYKNIMISATDSDFEPYKPIQTVTLPYTLNAIPVESGGNVTIDGQQYIADYVDVERGKLVQRIWRGDFGGNANERWIVNNRYERFNISIDKLGSNYSYTEKSVYCNRYQYNTNVYSDTKRENGIVRHGKVLYFRDSNITNLSESGVRLYLTEHPLIIITYLDEPIEIDLTQEEVSIFKKLATYYPITNISVTSEQLDGYTIFNYPISMANGWNYVKQQLNDNRDYIYDMDLQSAEAYVNSEYTVALTELEV